MNAVANLEQLGKTFGFGFLWEPASYDINQALISYTSRDTHFRAAVVGLINTGLIAVAGCVFATILGFTFGVLRLSSNWLINRMVYCYVEFRSEEHTSELLSLMRLSYAVFCLK